MNKERQIDRKKDIGRKERIEVKRERKRLKKEQEKGRVIEGIKTDRVTYKKM